jgi:hypothetical protein
MRSLKVVPLVLWLSLLIVSSAHVLDASPSEAASESAPTAPPDSYAITDVTMILSRTSCYGTCPVYTVVVGGEGACVFTGIHFTAVQGERAFRIEPKAALDLLNEFYRIDFLGLRDQYLERVYVDVRPDGMIKKSFGSVVDDPHTLITLKLGTYSKTIEKNSEFGPTELVDLADRIDRVTNSAQWIKK